MNTNHTLKTLCRAISPLSVSTDCDFELTAITADSRAVKPGCMFVAVRGTRVDGHDYIPAAVKAGAAAVVCECLPPDADSSVAWVMVADAARALGLLASQWHGNPSRRMTVVGVTGTNGKTTIATLLYDVMMSRGIKAGLLSTVVNKICDTDVPSTHTTPDPLELQALMARMEDAGCEFVAMEVSSHAAAQHRIAGIDFDGGIFTNLTRDHLDYHGTFAAYLEAKKSFFDSLKPEAFALTNADDRNGEVMLQNCRAHRYTYSIRSGADFRGMVIEDCIDGMIMTFDGHEVHTLFAGRFNASNLTAVYGATRLLGFDTDDALLAISTLRPVQGRFQTFRSADGVTAIVDYAHTPDALANVLETIREIRRPGQQILCVCGCGGDRDRGKRPIMAAEAVRLSDRVIITSDNPRSEDPAAIIAEMLAGVEASDRPRVLSIQDRAEAIRTAVALAAPGDIILVAGKGHETYQIIGSETHHFDDREQVSLALSQRI